ncbi:hypothetical protein [Sphingomonas sp. PAMC 26605]|uniref:hypothetical protein n=1 Tax=Sphingomonas sp. PAMC 26605 TaxID=1112214 RepID=UPI0002F52867|nr:hypothetical protein [Sphingomonas sp. PAMC 26605]
MARLPCDIPIEATAEHGEVLLDGPDGLAASLTPAAARQSAKRMAKAADTAERDPSAEPA